MKLNRLQTLAGIPLTEEKLVEAKTKEQKLDAVELSKYESSEDFENGFSTANQGAKIALQILDSAGFKGWMKASKDNYGWSDESYKKTLEAARDLVKAMDKLYDELEELS